MQTIWGGIAVVCFVGGVGVFLVFCLFGLGFFAWFGFLGTVLFVCLGFVLGVGWLGFIPTLASLLPQYYFLYCLPPSCGLNLPLCIQLFPRQAIYISLSI